MNINQQEEVDARRMILAFMVPFATVMLGLAIAFISNWCNGIYS